MPTYALNSILPSVNHLPLARTDSERVMLETIPEAHDSATLMMDHYERKNPPRSRKTSEAKTKQTPEKRALIKKGRDLGHQLIEQHQKLVLLAKQKKTVMLGLISPKTVSAKNIDYIDSKFKEDLAEINVLYMGRGTHDDDEKSLDLEDNHACLMRSLQILYEVVDVKILDWLHVGTTKDGSAEPGNLFKLLDAAENNESKEGIAVEREKEQMRPLLRKKKAEKEERDECDEMIDKNEAAIQKLEKKLEKLDKLIKKKIHSNNSKYKYAKEIVGSVKRSTQSYLDKSLEIDKLIQENVEQAMSRANFDDEIRHLRVKIKSRKSVMHKHQVELEYYQKLQTFIKTLLGYDAETQEYNPMRVEMIKSMIQEILQPSMQELEIIEDLRARTHASMERLIETANAYDMQESKFWRLYNGVKSDLEKAINTAFVLKEEVA